MSIFAVLRARGPAWDDAVPMDGQRDWRGHREFMNGIEADGFAVLGGPLDDGRHVLLIVRADDEEEVRSRLAADPWSEELLRVESVRSWSLRLGSLDR